MEKLTGIVKSNSKSLSRILVFLLLAVTSYFILTGRGFDLITFQNNIQRLQYFGQNYLLFTIMIYLIIRYIFAVVSIPGTGVLTIVGGAIFNFWLALLLVSLSVSLGVLTVFLLSRHAFRNLIKEKLSHHFQAMEQLLERYGPSLLFLLRICELFPSFVINSFFALTPIKTFTYFWISFIGHLPGIIVFVNAGSRINEIEQVGDLLQPSIFLSLSALALLPLLTKVIYNKILSRPIKI